LWRIVLSWDFVPDVRMKHRLAGPEPLHSESPGWAVRRRSRRMHRDEHFKAINNTREKGRSLFMSMHSCTFCIHTTPPCLSRFDMHSHRQVHTTMRWGSVIRGTE